LFFTAEHDEHHMANINSIIRFFLSKERVVYIERLHTT